MDRIAAGTEILRGAAPAASFPTFGDDRYYDDAMKRGKAHVGSVKKWAKDYLLTTFFFQNGGLETDAAQKAYIAERERVWEQTDPAHLTLRVLVEIDIRTMGRA